MFRMDRAAATWMRGSCVVSMHRFSAGRVRLADVAQGHGGHAAHPHKSGSPPDRRQLGSGWFHSNDGRASPNRRSAATGLRPGRRQLGLQVRRLYSRFCSTPSSLGRWPGPKPGWRTAGGSPCPRKRPVRSCLPRRRREHGQASTACSRTLSSGSSLATRLSMDCALGSSSRLNAIAALRRIAASGASRINSAQPADIHRSPYAPGRNKTRSARSDRDRR